LQVKNAEQTVRAKTPHQSAKLTASPQGEAKMRSKILGISSFDKGMYQPIKAKHR